MAHLIAQNLSKRFGRRRLFLDLSFTLTGGQALAVTGANGAGKSTLLRILAGVLVPTRGEVTLADAAGEIPAEDRPLRTGFVAPYLNVYDGFTARENLHFLARVRHLTGARDRIEELLRLVGLEDRADDFVANYSSGMKQRVKFAAALLGRPPLLLLDEPGTNLDAAGREMVDRVIEMQRGEGKLLVLATNDPGEARRCDAALRIGATGSTNP